MVTIDNSPADDKLSQVQQISPEEGEGGNKGNRGGGKEGRMLKKGLIREGKINRGREGMMEL